MHTHAHMHTCTQPLVWATTASPLWIQQTMQSRPRGCGGDSAAAGSSCVCVPNVHVCMCVCAYVCTVPSEPRCRQGALIQDIWSLSITLNVHFAPRRRQGARRRRAS